MSDDAVIRDLRPDDRDTFVDVIAGAFAGDPVFTDLLESAEHGRALIRYLFGFTTSMGGTRLGLFVGDELAGAALVEPPGGMRWSARMAAEAVRFLPLALRLGPSTSRALNDYQRISRAAAPTEPHHYLAMVGVATKHQGAGHGRRLLDGVKELARRHPGSTGVALDTENPDNVALYTSMGFRLTEVAEHGRLSIHAMRWDSAPG
jgi:ribosomal protein S18 acetylase RimI-like enzyme